MSVAPLVAPLLIGSLFYGKCGKCKKCRWLPRWLPCSLAICFIENVENVKKKGNHLSESTVHTAKENMAENILNRGELYALEMNT